MLTHAHVLRLVITGSLLALGANLGACAGCGGGGGGEGEGEGEGDAGEGEGDGGEGEGDTDVRITCDNVPAVSPGADVCAVTAGTGGVVVVGELLLPGEIIEGGGVTVDDDGTISCVGCDCIDQAAGRAVVVCPDAVVSPGFINAHDHAGWMNDVPWIGATESPPVDPAVRWEQRHDWRKGLRNNPKIHVGGGANAEAKALGELRFVLGGGTATNASGGFKLDNGGFLRNVDDGDDMGPIGAPFVDYETFPLDDSDGTQNESGCNYGTIVTPPAGAPYAPHISEGIDKVAHNEFVCLSSNDGGGTDVISDKTAIIHGIGLLPADVAVMAQRGASLIWSPRSNVSLYGDTAQIPMFEHVGVNVALGTDWIPSGSMSMLRELQCVIDLNGEHWSGELSDQTIWRMVTVNSAHAIGADAVLGTLALGHRGDIAVFPKTHADGQTLVDYRAAIEASPADVALVLKDGHPMSGNAAVVDALEQGCDDLDVCGSAKKVCATREAGQTLAALEAAANGSHYDLFFCDVPTDEPSCDPARSLPDDVINQSTQYTGADSASDGDGDGIPDDADDCPGTFNPVRPLDDGAQGDADGDGVGDVCDPCPLDADTTDCVTFNADDKDGDGFNNVVDNCPDDSNADQADADNDLKGDACDACPNDANPGNAGCPKSVYDLKSSDPAAVDGSRVSVPDVVVTAVDRQGFFLQVDPDAASFNGTDNGCIFVFAPPSATVPAPAPGDRIAISGTTVSNFFTQIELKDVEFSVTSSGAPPPPVTLSPSDVVTAVGAKARALSEGCVVRVEDVSVTNADPVGVPNAGDVAADNEFEIDGGLRVDDFIFLIDPQPGLAEQFTFVQGPMPFKNGLLKVLPRDASDVGFADAAIAAVEPPLSFVRLSTGPVSSFPTATVVRLNRAAASDTTVLLSSSSAEITVPASITVPAGELSAPVPVTASATASTATISARLVATDPPKDADVQSIADDAAPSVVSIDPPTASLAFGASQVFTVTFDIPTSTTGNNVTLAASPGTLGTLTSPLAAPANVLSATFTFTAGTTAQSGSVSATLGATHAATVDVLDPATLDVDLSGFKILQANANATATLPAGTHVPVGGFLIIARACGTSSTSTNCPLSASSFASHWQVTFGADDVFILGNTLAGNGGNGFPTINGDETFTLERPDGSIVDGPTLALEGSKTLERIAPTGDPAAAASWTARSDAPGGGTNPGSATGGARGGCYISEVGDSSGTGNFVFEFVEIHCDATTP